MPESNIVSDIRLPLGANRASISNELETSLFLTPTPTNDNTIPIKTTKDDDDEGSRNNA